MRTTELTMPGMGDVDDQAVSVREAGAADAGPAAMDMATAATLTSMHTRLDTPRFPASFMTKPYRGCGGLLLVESVFGAVTVRTRNSCHVL